MGGCESCDKKECPSRGDHESGLADEERLARSLSRIKHKIVVLSGKGGVGKSTVATNIAMALSFEGKQVGLLDVDVHGPSVPRLLSLKGMQPAADRNCIDPVPWSRNLRVMSLGFLLQDESQAVIWRGPVKMGLIKQFLRDVAWGELDYLVVDCPPGTGDEPLTVLQLLGQEAKAVIVTTPQGVATDDVRRSVSFCREMGVGILGIVENMSGFICPGCGERHDIFATGGGERLAKESQVPFLGAIPIDPEMVRAGDEGFAMLKVHPDSPTAKAIKHVIEPMLAL